MKSCKGCKHYKKDERTRLVICEFDLHESCCEKDKEDFAIEELEKIKTEIDDYAVIDGSNATKRGFEIMQGIVLEIVDNHISELKGEHDV